MRKLAKISAILLAITFCLSTTHVFAEEIIPTDSGDQNVVSTEDCNQATIDSEASTNNNLVLEADTGHNEVADSTVIDNFSSGEITGQTTAIKDSNSTLASGSQIAASSSESDDQVNAADFSNQESVFIIGTDANSSNNDDADHFLDLESQDTVLLDFNTGENEFKNNTYVEQAETGDINFAANLVNVDNLINPELLLNLSIYSILGDFTGDVVLEDEFLNQPVDVEIFDQTSDLMANHESITSTADFGMNTGSNTLSENSLVGDISSGDANGGYFQTDFAGLLTTANFFILNVLDDWEGENLLSGYDNVIINNLSQNDAQMQILGADDSNTTESNIEQDTTFSAMANTGRNTFNRNTYLGKLSTGDIDLMELIINLKPNLRSLTNKLNIRVLNILGNWRGNLRKAQASTPDIPTVPDEQAVEQHQSETANEVLGVSESVALAQADTADTSTQVKSASIDPGQIEAGTNISYLAFLLLLLPLIVAARFHKKA